MLLIVQPPRRLILGLLTLLAAGWFSPSVTSATEIKTLEFAALLAAIDSDQPYLLMDTRSPQTYDDGHLPGAVNYPGYLFDDVEIPNLPENLDLSLIVYCSGVHCGLAEFVAERLELMGYSQVFLYAEGVEGWLTHDQLLVTKRHESLPQINRHDLNALLATGAKIRLLDARPPAEFAQGAPAGAVNLPLSSCRPRGPGMPQALDQTIIVYGQSGWDSRAFHLADRLQTMGFRHVLLFQPGFRGWPVRYQPSLPVNQE